MIINPSGKVGHRFFRFGIKLVFFLGVFLFQSGCELSALQKQLLEEAFGLAPAPNVSAPQVGEACFSDRYTQPQGSYLKKVDLLFVTDTSGSLSEERGQIADGIDSFIAALPADVDYQVGVMLAHGQAAHAGKLFKRRSEPWVLGKDMRLADLRSALRRKLMEGPDDSTTDGGEAGLYSFNRALDFGMLQDARAKGFFREDAALAVIFISDENDICARYPAGVTPVPDPQRIEPRAFREYCTRQAPARPGRDSCPASPAQVEDITPELVLEKLRQLYAHRSFLVGAIAYTGEAPIPREGENEYGYGYLDLVRLAQGISIDLAAGHFAQGLERVGRLTTEMLELRKDFPIPADVDVDPATIKVLVDGVEVLSSYDPLTRIVHIEDAGRARSVIDVAYCSKVILPPEEGGGGSGGDTGSGDSGSGEGGDTSGGGDTGSGGTGSGSEGGDTTGSGDTGTGGTGGDTGTGGGGTGGGDTGGGIGDPVGQ